VIWLIWLIWSIWSASERERHETPGLPPLIALTASGTWRAVDGYRVKHPVSGVEISKSRVWPSFPIFIIEDDAQNGPDHVNSHRTDGLVIKGADVPYPAPVRSVLPTPYGLLTFREADGDSR